MPRQVPVVDHRAVPAQHAGTATETDRSAVEPVAAVGSRPPMEPPHRVRVGRRPADARTARPS